MRTEKVKKPMINSVPEIKKMEKKMPRIVQSYSTKLSLQTPRDNCVVQLCKPSDVILLNPPSNREFNYWPHPEDRPQKMDRTSPPRTDDPGPNTTGPGSPAVHHRTSNRQWRFRHLVGGCLPSHRLPPH
jgi:hypothetical protein